MIERYRAERYYGFGYPSGRMFAIYDRRWDTTREPIAIVDIAILDDVMDLLNRKWKVRADIEFRIAPNALEL